MFKRVSGALSHLVTTVKARRCVYYWHWKMLHFAILTSGLLLLQTVIFWAANEPLGTQSFYLHTTWIHYIQRCFQILQEIYLNACIGIQPSNAVYTPKWCDINEGNSMSHHFRPMYFTYPRFMWLTHPWIASAMHSRNSCGEVKEKHKRIWFLWARLGFFSRDIRAMSQLVLHSLIQTHLPVKIVASTFEISLL